MITLTEVMDHSIRFGNQALAERHRLIARSENQMAISVSEPIAREAASLRATYNLKTPDAIQLATAIHAGAGLKYLETHSTLFPR